MLDMFQFVGTSHAVGEDQLCNKCHLILCLSKVLPIVLYSQALLPYLLKDKKWQNDLEKQTILTCTCLFPGQSILWGKDTQESGSENVQKGHWDIAGVDNPWHCELNIPCCFSWHTRSAVYPSNWRSKAIERAAGAEFVGEHGYNLWMSFTPRLSELLVSPMQGKTMMSTPSLEVSGHFWVVPAKSAGCVCQSLRKDLSGDIMSL